MSASQSFDAETWQMCLRSLADASGRLSATYVVEQQPPGNEQRVCRMGTPTARDLAHHRRIFGSPALADKAAAEPEERCRAPF